MVPTSMRYSEPLKGSNGLGKLTGSKVIIQRSQKPCADTLRGCRIRAEPL